MTETTSGAETLDPADTGELRLGHTARGTAANDVVTVLAEDMVINASYTLGSEYDFLGRRIRPFAWLGTEFE